MPYSEKACKDAGARLNLKPGSSGWNFKIPGFKWKGCYAYDDGSYPGVYYGTGGTTEDMKTALDSPRYRPKGYDCSVDGKYFFSSF